MAPPDRRSPRISVVVCTRNRSVSLLEACNAILELEVPPRDEWELLIVDNASTDDTLAVARGLAAREPERVRVVVEPELGLSAARNTGIREARGDIIAFIDDDALPAATWLSALEEALAQPGVLAAGGPVEPWFSGDLPGWLDERYLPYVSAFDKGPGIQDLHHNEYPRGANVAFRREAFADFGPFSVDLGRKGDRLRSCEESELCLRLERGSARVLYHSDAGVRHRVEVDRLSVPWMAKRFHAQGQSEAIVAWQHGGLRELLRGWFRIGKNAVAATRRHGPGDDLYAKLQRQTLLGYTGGLVLAPLTTRRYRPPRARALEVWRPEGSAGIWTHPALR